MTSIGHEYGPDSAQTDAEILVFLMTMEQVFLKAMAGNRKKIMFLLTADHGQTETDPQTTIYINRDPRFTGVEKFIQDRPQGELIIPAGSARDFFLYIKDGMVDEAQAFLASRLEGKAEVRKVAELMDEGTSAQSFPRPSAARRRAPGHPALPRRISLVV